MKLFEIQPGAIETGNDKYTAYLSDRPFWSLNIEPKNNPFYLFSFVGHQNKREYKIFMPKTSYYTSPVISKSFASSVELSEVIDWIDKTLMEIKEGL